MEFSSKNKKDIEYLIEKQDIPIEYKHAIKRYLTGDSCALDGIEVNLIFKDIESDLSYIVFEKSTNYRATNRMNQIKNKDPRYNKDKYNLKIFKPEYRAIAVKVFDELIFTGVLNSITRKFKKSKCNSNNKIFEGVLAWFAKNKFFITTDEFNMNITETDAIKYIYRSFDAKLSMCQYNREKELKINSVIKSIKTLVIYEKQKTEKPYGVK